MRHQGRSNTIVPVKDTTSDQASHLQFNIERKLKKGISEGLYEEEPCAEKHMTVYRQVVKPKMVDYADYLFGIGEYDSIVCYQMKKD